ncbi:MAG: hypothetical protein COB33_003140 [Thiotrichaceae bacterium]|nr:hypothetical protein [Thiotrichaceae bacterium]PCI12317.1 MAG: hypothetical protein COB71_09595 [Thiotrichales bacterium]
MNIPQAKLLRLQFLARIVQKEIRYLGLTDQRLFPVPFTRQQVERLDEEIELSERVDAFVSRFGRLQDTVGDKLLPQYLNALGETTGPAIDNLNRAEKIGLIHSAEIWLALRDMRNQMVHEYMEDLDKRVNALNKAHEYVDTLSNDAGKILSDMASRGWVELELER